VFLNQLFILTFFAVKHSLSIFKMFFSTLQENAITVDQSGTRMTAKI